MRDEESRSASFTRDNKKYKFLGAGQGGDGAPSEAYGAPGSGGSGGYIDVAYLEEASLVGNPYSASGGSGGIIFDRADARAPNQVWTVDDAKYLPTNSSSAGADGVSGTVLNVTRGGAGGTALPGLGVDQYGAGGHGGKGGEPSSSGIPGANGHNGLVVVEFYTD